MPATIHPADSSATSCFSKVFLLFVGPLLKRGIDLDESDLFPLREIDGAEKLSATLQTKWDDEVSSAAATSRPPRFSNAWSAAFLRIFAPVGVFAWLKAMLALAQSRCVLGLLGVIGDSSRSTSEGLWFAFLAGLLGLVAAVSDAIYWRETWFWGRRWQVATLGVLYAKASRLRLDALASVSTGHAISLASNDVERFLQVVHHLPHLVLTPLDGAVYTVFLFIDLGPAAFAGVGLTVAICLLQLLCYSRAYGRLRRARAGTTDARLDLTSQVLAGIRVIKANSWEPPFVRACRDVREREVRLLRDQYRVRGTFEGFIHSKYLILTAASLLTLWATGEPITPERIYSASSLFYLLEMDRVWRFVENAENVTDALVSFGRFTQFLLLPEVTAAGGSAEGGEERVKIATKATAVASSDRAAPVFVGAPEGDRRAVLNPVGGGDNDSDWRECLRFSSPSSSSLSSSYLPLVPPSANRGSASSTSVVAVEVKDLVASVALVLKREGGGGAAHGSPRNNAVITASAAAGAPKASTDDEDENFDPAAAFSAARVGMHDVLSGFTLRIPRGELCAIVGEIGSGKSSLLLALLGELNIRRGSARVNGTISYAPQQAFIASGSVRANIFFGAPPDEARLRRVLDAVCLSGEVSGDTLVGEKGVTLSGGQRARIGLARAVYREADVYLFDDPLSALDAKVGAAVFERCIRGPIIRAGATVLLVTHQLQFLRRVGRICIISGKTLAAEGSYTSLSAQLLASSGTPQAGGANRANVGVALGGLLDAWAAEAHQAGEETEKTVEASAALSKAAPSSSGVALLEDAPPPVAAAAGSGRGEVAAGSAVASQPSSDTTAVVVAPSSSENAAAPGDSDEPTSSSSSSSSAEEAAAAAEFKEEGGRGAVTRETFLTYGRYWFRDLAGRLDSVHIAIVMVASAVAFPAVGGYLGYWCSLPLAEQQRWQPAATYAFIVAAALLSAVWRPIAFTARAVLAGRDLHNDVFNAVLRAPTSFFDARPAGSILSRFAKDVQVVDERLPLVACDVILQVGRAGGVLALVCAENPWMLLALPPLAGAFWRVRSRFARASRALKRLESASRPPILSIFAETLAGLAVVRAFDSAARLRGAFAGAVDANTRAWTTFYSLTRWLALRLDLLCVALFTAAAASAVLARGAGVSAGGAATSLSVISMLLGELDWMVRQSVELENAMLSVERLLAYGAVEGEAVELLEDGEETGGDAAVTIRTPPAAWPSRGHVELREVWLRYAAAPAGVFALRGVSFALPAGAKLGVVGRTGAGKSSLLAALLRLTEPSRRGGSGDTGVLIDGVDTARIPLSRLRRACSVISQEPVLYGGTVRSNIDPLGRATDARCLAALEAVCMAKAVGAIGGLDAPVSENGGNLSVGQRQLLCLARAVLRDAKILYLDEATANVDADTDAAIQAAIRSAFRHTTVITVAHRLATVMDSDLIVVMDAGRVVQCGPPRVLAADADGPLAGLLREAESAAAAQKQGGERAGGAY